MAGGECAALGAAMKGDWGPPSRLMLGRWLVGCDYGGESWTVWRLGLEDSRTWPSCFVLPVCIDRSLVQQILLCACLCAHLLVLREHLFKNRKLGWKRYCEHMRMHVRRRWAQNRSSFEKILMDFIHIACRGAGDSPWAWKSREVVTFYQQESKIGNGNEWKAEGRTFHNVFTVESDCVEGIKFLPADRA